MQIKKTLEIPPHTSQCVYLHTHLEIISMFHSKNHHDKSNSLFFFSIVENMDLMSLFVSRKIYAKI